MDPRNHYSEQGRHYPAEGAPTQTLVDFNYDWGVVLNPKDQDGKTTIHSFEYKGEAMPENLWWKTLKNATTYKELLTCIWKWEDSEEDVPYQPAIEICRYFGYSEQFWIEIKPLTYGEAFAIPNDELRITSFSNIDVNSMVEELGYERIDTKAIEVRQGGEMITQMFELLKIPTGTLMGEGNRGSDVYNYAVRCWCTTTDETHHLWVQDEFATDALTAIASTCYVQEDIFDHITGIKRQGDLFFFLFEESFDMDRIDPTKPRRPLNSEEYFSMMLEQS